MICKRALSRAACLPGCGPSSRGSRPAGCCWRPSPKGRSGCRPWSSGTRPPARTWAVQPGWHAGQGRAADSRRPSGRPPEVPQLQGGPRRQAAGVQGSGSKVEKRLDKARGRLQGAAHVRAEGPGLPPAQVVQHAALAAEPGRELARQVVQHLLRELVRRLLHLRATCSASAWQQLAGCADVGALHHVGVRGSS